MNNGDNDVVNNNKPALSFRNYVPKDGNLDNNKPTDAANNDDNVSKRQKTSSDNSSNYNDDDGDSNKPKSALELALAKTNRESREASAGHNVGKSGTWSKVTPISTKKVNWDLKRDIQQKMDKLDRYNI